MAENISVFPEHMHGRLISKELLLDPLLLDLLVLDPLLLDPLLFDPLLLDLLVLDPLFLEITLVLYSPNMLRAFITTHRGL